MNTLNTELVKILKAMETKYKMLEMEFNAVKKKWQEDSDISKNELNKIRQEREVLMKTIYALEEKLSKSDKRINELKQLKCEEKGIMKENVDAYETDDVRAILPFRLFFITVYKNSSPSYLSS